MAPPHSVDGSPLFLCFLPVIHGLVRGSIRRCVTDSHQAYSMMYFGAVWADMNASDFGGQNFSVEGHGGQGRSQEFVSKGDKTASGGRKSSSRSRPLQGYSPGGSLGVKT